MMFNAVESPYLVAYDGSFRVGEAATSPGKNAPGKKDCKKQLAACVDELHDLQRILYAHDRHAVLLVFQAMDAAGKDGTIRAVLSGVNPAGCEVSSFKVPSVRELDHDFLWRSATRLPERGRIGVFNRSYYEEVLVVRVHPEYLSRQQLPDGIDLETIWQERLTSIHDHELHLARNGVVILKFFLNVSKEEQRQRFLARLDEPEKNWKFSFGDVTERGHWDAYQAAYESALAATSKPWAPWYAVPADDKPFMRLAVARIVEHSLRTLDLRYPEPKAADRARFAEMRQRLTDEAETKK